MTNQLRETGELDNTYVIFQSDNGLLHGEHDIFDKNVPWDRSVRIPLLIRGPGFDCRASPHGPDRQRRRAGDDPGRRERRARRGPSTATRCSASTGAASSCSSGSTARPGSSATQPWRQIKTASGWTYWRELISGRRHLYDLNEDPLQLHNRVRGRTKLARRLEQKVERFRRCKAPCP